LSTWHLYKREKKVEFFKSFNPLLYTVVNKVIQLSWIRARALGQSNPTVGIFEVPVRDPQSGPGHNRPGGTGQRKNGFADP
jgi:hypothetical protein